MTPEAALIVSQTLNLQSGYGADEKGYQLWAPQQGLRGPAAKE